MKHTISVIVENKFGVLSRVTGLFSGRGYNIESLSVAPIDDNRFSRITLVTTGDDKVVEQITKQLHKLINTIKVIDLTNEEHIERELLLVKINCPNTTVRSEILQIMDIFRGKTVDVAVKSITVEVTGAAEKVNAFIDMIRPFGIKEMARTGKVAMLRGQKP
ncbi:acetolactate synthase small subunit [Desulfurispirillum indicum]|uniref:Acetolactate synthase small subunit n=1 Tax=Desulfurispirillum indicum (strain ATCC BAA-1389 / DSM 22839 / S5) TaxID=653733 RepID=E6W5D3_DESIS|nr:acetolactate synthase small subunit [Desulfurispirillum indicum]ADU64864.1 acetolactate synthase, small subunit [Desulfurispirillum indicum S5]UCZ56795.1 acetolactate synthase small subunit [Desulfurispirillum indicum]